MPYKTFIILLLSTQFFFVGLDFFYVYKLSKIKSTTNPLRFRSFLFLVVVVICYSVIQYGGLALIPKMEVLLRWFTNHIPTVGIFDLNRGGLPIIGWLVLGVFIYYAAGFWDYIVHRFFSHSKLFFFTHEYHHLPNRLFLALPGLIARPFSLFSNALWLFATFSSVIFVLKTLNLQNLPLLPLLYVIIFIETTILSITHSEFFTKQWWIYKVFKYLAITSPQEHEIHHTVDLAGNYGDFTSLWDKLFGTYIDPSKAENQNHALGLGYDQDFLGALTIGKIKFSKKIRDRFQIGKYCNIEDDHIAISSKAL